MYNYRYIQCNLRKVTIVFSLYCKTVLQNFFFFNPTVISLVIGKKNYCDVIAPTIKKFVTQVISIAYWGKRDQYTATKYTGVILSRLLLFLSLTNKVMQWEPRDSSGTYQGEAVGGGGPSLDCGQRPGLQDLKPHRTFVQRE